MSLSFSISGAFESSSVMASSSFACILGSCFESGDVNFSNLGTNYLNTLRSTRNNFSLDTVLGICNFRMASGVWISTSNFQDFIA